MIKKVFVWIPFVMAVLLSVAVVVYCLLQMNTYPCMLDVKIAATFVTVITFGFFSWFIYVLTLDMYNDLKK